MIPITHTTCGKQGAWYLRDEPRSPDLTLAEDYLRMDGTQPRGGDIFREICPACGNPILGAREMKREFTP